MTPGTITPVSAGTKQGVFRPQVRVYYHHARHGICFETLTKPLRCRSRARAVSLAKEWINSPDFSEVLSDAFARISANPDNKVTP